MFSMFQVKFCIQVNKEEVRSAGGVLSQEVFEVWLDFSVRKRRKPIVWSSWWAIDRTNTPNRLFNKSKYDSQTSKRVRERERERTHPIISKAKKKKPLKAIQWKQILALVFHLLLNQGGWEEVQNIGYHNTVLQWHDEKLKNPQHSQHSAARTRKEKSLFIKSGSLHLVPQNEEISLA